MPGKVSLVGSGPGDPDLLTVKAHRLLQSADVVLYDNLTGSGILDLVRETARTKYVGKQPGPDSERTTQTEINRLMVEHADAGRDVVRLKGGDPMVFGRGGEEAEHLAAEGIRFEIVPGVSSVVAAPGSVGIPLTHREHASSLSVITGHEDPTKAESAIDWSAIADQVAAGGTLLILMGVGRLPENVAVLREEGLDPETPVAMVEKATREGEQTVTGSLETIVAEANDAGVAPPAMTIVGDVVSVRERIADHLTRETSPVPPAYRAAFDATGPAGAGSAVSHGGDD